MAHEARRFLYLGQPSRVDRREEFRLRFEVEHAFA